MKPKEIDKIASAFAIDEVKDTCNPASKRGLLYVGFITGAKWADAHPHWISVEDELPKEDGKYLIYTKSGQQIIANYECHRGKWHQFNEAFFTPTHWSHLPQPPLVTDLNKKDLPPLSCQEGKILVEEEGGEEPNKDFSEAMLQAAIKAAKVGYSYAVDEAAEWLHTALYLDHERSIEHRYATLEELLNDFRKAMKGE